jgi:DNA-binding MarR family transcriptional regulator
VANVSPNDTELERLLTQLLRFVSPAFTRESSAGEPLAEESSPGESSPGESSPGEPLGGEQSAGESLAGEQSAGDPLAGEQSAGESLAGTQSAVAAENADAPTGDAAARGAWSGARGEPGGRLERANGHEFSQAGSEASAAQQTDSAAGTAADAPWTDLVAGRAGGTEVDAGTASALPALSASEARALIELVSARGIAQGELAGLLGLEKSTVSRLAAGLERKGWIRRGRDGENQRYVRLYLTADGAAVADRVWRAWQSRQARILAGLSEDERAGLSAGLRGLVRGLAAEGLLGDAAPRG